MCKLSFCCQASLKKIKNYTSGSTLQAFVRSSSKADERVINGACFKDVLQFFGFPR